MFASPAKGLAVDGTPGVVRVSSIFKWFGEDFSSLGNGDARAGVREFAARYVANPALAAQLRSTSLTLRYLDYDWSLNE